jgi:hypothetical protein
MKTPTGRECKHYYGDFHRGRSVQACRLIERNPDSLPWKPSLCETCPVPDILRANASDSLVLDGKVVKKFFGFKMQVEVEGWCSECFSAVPDPMRGCPNCRQTSHRPSIFDLGENPE